MGNWFTKEVSSRCFRKKLRGNTPQPRQKKAWAGHKIPIETKGPYDPEELEEFRAHLDGQLKRGGHKGLAKP